MDQIEIYLRPSGDRNLLNIYVPKDRAEQFLAGIKAGTFESDAVLVAFEASVQERWKTTSGDNHIRVPISAINVLQTDE